MSFRCDVCGVEYPLDQAVRRTWIIRPKRIVYCRPCWQKLDLDYGLNLLILALVAALCVPALLWLLPDGGLRLLAAFILLIVFQSICVLPHELGHAIGAWLVGMRVFTISVGLGPVAVILQILGHDFVFRSIPVGGHTLAVHKTLRLARLKHLFCVLGGPLVNVCMIVAAFYVWPESSPDAPADWIIGTFVLSNAITLAICLYPMNVFVDGSLVPNDGLALLTVLLWKQERIKDMHAEYFYLEGLESRERGKPEDAVEWFQRCVAEYPAQPWGYIGLFQLCHDQGRYAEAREFLVKALDTEPLSEVEATLWNNLAWTNLMLGTPELLEEAYRLSKQAFDQAGSISQVKGTRGSVLVECGEIDQGIKLLQAAITENEALTDKALNACYLAMAMAKQNDLAEAERFIGRARKLDPKCPLIERAVRELEARSQPDPVDKPVD